MHRPRPTKHPMKMERIATIVTTTTRSRNHSHGKIIAIISLGVTTFIFPVFNVIFRRHNDHRKMLLSPFRTSSHYNKGFHRSALHRNANGTLATSSSSNGQGSPVMANEPHLFDDAELNYRSKYQTRNGNAYGDRYDQRHIQRTHQRVARIDEG